jgi:hypothetical protein
MLRPSGVKCFKCAQYLLHMLKVKSHGPIQPTHPSRKKEVIHSVKWVTSHVSTKCAPMWNNVFTHSSHLYLSSYGFEEVYKVGQCLQVPYERRLFLPWDHRVSTIVTVWAPIQDYPFLGHCNYGMRWVTRGSTCPYFGWVQNGHVHETIPNNR